ncbi:nitroreductase family protein [Ruminiclostridium hungatei]|uniref:Nitroreductase family protein n=1 Tax=Ruminiclostridium hungatei TaxID=48256 RepID=A0A1V4SHR9_RUMHU|nr:nitroreductase family protein [Ruminiclostridium hungatei]OPX43419.1 nitroreductase family protein [Ruminiclostridium hungatei]
MDYLKAIEKRVSTRNYLGIGIDKEKLSVLTDEIDDGNKKFGLSISFLEDGSNAFNTFGKSYGMFKGVRSLIVMKGPQNDIHLKEKLGYVGEKVILKATSLGLGTCWVGGSFERQNPIFAVSEGEEFVCVITIGIVAEKKSLIGNVINKIKRPKAIEAFYTSDNAVPDWFIAGINAVQKAPSARNSQKVQFSYNDCIVRASVPDSYRFDLVDLGIAKLHFELAAGGSFSLGNNSKFQR